LHLQYSIDAGKAAARLKDLSDGHAGLWRTQGVRSYAALGLRIQFSVFVFGNCITLLKVLVALIATLTLLYGSSLLMLVHRLPALMPPCLLPTLFFSIQFNFAQLRIANLAAANYNICTVSKYYDRVNNRSPRRENSHINSISNAQAHPPQLHKQRPRNNDPTRPRPWITKKKKHQQRPNVN
jgi:hypothetical protein